MTPGAVLCSALLAAVGFRFIPLLLLFGAFFGLFKAWRILAVIGEEKIDLDSGNKRQSKGEPEQGACK